MKTLHEKNIILSIYSQKPEQQSFIAVNWNFAEKNWIKNVWDTCVQMSGLPMPYK